MADTEDVAEVLFQFLTGLKYRGEVEVYTYRMDDVDPAILFKHLEVLATVEGIGIESAKRLLWQAQHSAL